MTPKRCGPGVAEGRLTKAEQFHSAAETIMEHAAEEADVGDAYVTLCVHAGIAAADVICCKALGQHSSGSNHADAVALLKKVPRDGASLAAALNRLLQNKTRAGYSANPVTAAMRTEARSASTKLVNAARERA
jgi:hypothetical protein